eukprot:c12010_g1_i1.p1 GENE.c12010_g1_i1~~c12010_g1_i1.p1  ORF type:complete len:204 (+),score=53.14 c12010_g1_i1:169-780(+)
MSEDARELEKFFLEQKGVNSDVVLAQTEVMLSIANLTSAVLSESGPVLEYSNLARNYPANSMTILRFICGRVSPSLSSTKLRQVVEDCEAAGAIQARNTQAPSHQQKTGRALLTRVFQDQKDEFVVPDAEGKQSKGRFFGFGSRQGKNETPTATATQPPATPNRAGVSQQAALSASNDGMNIPVFSGEDLFGGSLPPLQITHP